MYENQNLKCNFIKNLAPLCAGLIGGAMCMKLFQLSDKEHIFFLLRQNCMGKHFHSSIAHLLGLTLFSFKYRSPVFLRMVHTYFHSSIAHLELVHTYFHSSIAQLENHGTTYTSVTNDILHR